MDGQIKRVVGDKGFGFILGADGVEYFFHMSALKNWSGRFEELATGLPPAVTFKATVGKKGQRAEDVYIS